MSDGSAPLLNENHETYAVARAKGLSQAESYKTTIPFGTAHKGGNASLRVSGHRLEKRQDIAARISYLRQQSRGAMVDASKPLTRVEVVEISLEVSGVLEATYRAALASSVSPQALERLKAVLAAHLARQGKLDDEPALLSEGDDAEISNIMDRIKVGECTCLAR